MADELVINILKSIKLTRNGRGISSRHDVMRKMLTFNIAYNEETVNAAILSAVASGFAKSERGRFSLYDAGEQLLLDFEAAGAIAEGEENRRNYLSNLRRTLPFDLFFELQGGERVGAHRFMMTNQNSAVLRNKVNAAVNDIVEVVLDVSSAELDAVVEYLYRRELLITGENVFPILKIASFFRLDILEEKCFDFVKSGNMTLTNIKTLIQACVWNEDHPLMPTLITFIKRNKFALLEDAEFVPVVRNHEAIVAALIRVKNSLEDTFCLV